ncbi:cellulase [Metarhizium guizhouense ARSEF 977]|uniref:Cellulase n=1 Tax=Metarhizium guizhouense (strain ARSEF 977) TaxID=1276136 RepID=A0A0B4HJP9_METGA|nr:cellulase [Metarhizium guizhouense ARSEF 977]
MRRGLRLPGPYSGDAAWAANRFPQDGHGDGWTEPEPERPLFSLPATRAAARIEAPGIGQGGDGGIVWMKQKQRAWPLWRFVSRRPRRWIFLGVVLLLGCFVGYFYRSEVAISAIWIPDMESVSFGKKPLPPPLERTQITNYTLPLVTKGRHIVDAEGRRFKLASINWYGASDELFVPGGLDVQHRKVIAQTIKKLGFNSVRLPYADELVSKNPVIDARLVRANADLVGLRALDILEAVATTLTEQGIAVIVNNHITRATWCCGANPCDAAWANDHLLGICKVTQSEDEWIRNWETVMTRFTNDPLVIGVDLRNEVRGLWGTMPWHKWAEAAERCGNRLLAMNPDWLVVVEGTESANDLRGARRRPVKLDIADRLVYSAHVYAWSGWGSLGGRFSKRTYESFRESMREHWGYLLEEDVAPVWVGEIGAPRLPASVGDVRYWKNLWRYLGEVDADFGYWALNPRKPKGNESEGYSLVEDDWVGVVLDYRMMSMVEAMRRE